MSTPKINAYKLAFLASQFPEKTIKELLGIFNIAPLSANLAGWKAEELGLIEIDRETEQVEVLAVEHQFGKEVDELKSDILYAYKKLSEEESDLEEGQLGVWAEDRQPEDLIIAVKLLLAEGKLASYTVTTTTIEKKSKRKKGAEVQEETYTFYCLPKNKMEQWGRKQFPNQKLLK